MGVGGELNTERREYNDGESGLREGCSAAVSLLCCGHIYEMAGSLGVSGGAGLVGVTVGAGATGAGW